RPNGGGAFDTAVHPELSRCRRRMPHQSGFDEHRRAAVRRRHSPWRVSREGRGRRTSDGTTSDGSGRSSPVLRVTSGPSTPHDLRMHRCINFRLPSAGTLYKWEFEKGHHSVEVAVQGPLIFDDEGLVIDA